MVDDGFILEMRILEILKMSAYPLRSSEIRDQLLLEGFSIPNLYVKVCRKLKSLVNRGYVEREDRGHKNVVYYLSANHEEKLLAKEGRSKVVVKLVGLGIYKLGDSYEQWRDKMVRKLEESQGWHERWQELNRFYEQKRKHGASRELK